LFYLNNYASHPLALSCTLGGIKAINIKENIMSAIKEMTATLRVASGKGAARAERRANRVPAVIYGDNKAPIAISLAYKEIYYKIYAGHFLSTVFDLNVDGTIHRVIPRDYQLEVVKDTPLHVDFLRLGANAEVKVEIAIHVKNGDICAGVKMGGMLNLIEHAIELFCKADAIPDAIDIDVAKLNIGDTIHLKDITLPAGTRAVSKENLTLISIAQPSAG
jgi:large subunit ribosomal protein L25